MEVGRDVKSGLLHVEAFHLHLIGELVEFGLGRLEVEAEERSALHHAVTAHAVDFNNAGGNGRVDDFLESGNHFAGGTDRGLDGAPLHL